MNAATTPARGQLVEANEQAARFFRAQLLAETGSGPRSYLESRGLADLLDATPWTVGYAPGSWTATRDHLEGLGFTPEVLDAAGLTSTTRRGGTIDRFRDRLTFGIRDLKGNLVGFTARCAPGAPANVPKYLNTPHTALYDKGSVLFGLGEQAPHLRDGANLVLVEGPLDALAVDLLNDARTRLAPVAACGTALTTHHADVLSGLVRGYVIVAFDRDEAGLKAAERAGLAMSGRLANPYASTLPTGSDPAQILDASGPQELRKCVTQLRPLATAIIDDHLGAWPNLDFNAEARVACLREVSHVLARLAPHDMTRHTARLATALDLDRSTVTRELADAVSAPHTNPGPTAVERRCPAQDTHVGRRASTSRRAGPAA